MIMMVDVTTLLALVAVLVAVVLPVGGAILHYVFKTETRLTRVETKIDMVLRHLGLNPGSPKEDEKKRQR